MDYTDPANRRLRDEPTLPLSPDEVQIAVNNHHAETLKKLFAFLNTPTLPNTTNNNEKEDIDPRHN